MGKYNIRKFNSSDIDDFIKLWNQEYEVLTSSKLKLTYQKAREGFNKKLFDYYGIYGKEDKLLGFLLLKKEKKVFWLKHVVIDKKRRNKGLGKKLLEKATSICQKEGKELMVEVIKENLQGKQFFLKNGFELVRFDNTESQFILRKVMVK